MAESEDARPAIGIDLGTTNSRVGIWLDEENCFHLIPNDLGHHTTPSYVAFTETERLIGDPAKDQVSKNPANTVFDVKRLIGRKFGDLGTDADKLHIQWPFKVARGGDEKPMIHVEYKGKEKVFSAVDVYAMILGQMKDLAEVYSGCVVNSASVSVPHCFTSAQRQATRNACSLAGFETVSLVNEPVCAALAYTLKTIGPSVGEKKVMVFDLGGGSLDVTLFTIEEGVIETKATSGESQLGGEDFDLRLLHHFVQEIKEKYERDITSHPRVMRTLKKQVERVKVTLSTELDANVQIDSLLEDFNFYSSISRGCFEEMNMDLFENCIRCVDECLQRAGLAKADVDEVVLVGGSSRIPKVQELLAEFFKDKSKLNTSIDPDEAVVCGAAARAGIALGCSAFTDYLVVDVIPMSLGLETVGGVMHVMHPRNSSMPRSSEQLFTTVHDDQPGIFIQVYEGENSHSCNNMLVATVELPGIAPAPRGVPQILVRFDVDTYGILTVSAKDKTTGEKVEVCMDQEVDIDREHHDEERRQGLPIQVYHPSSPSEDSNGPSSLLGQREPINTRKGSLLEFSEPSPAYRPSIAVESSSQELPEAYESRNIAESRSQEVAEPSPASEPSNIVESGPVKISEPFPGYEPSNTLESKSQEISEPSPAFESSNAVEFFEASQAFEPEESRSLEFLEPPVAYGLSDTIEKSSQEYAEPPQVYESYSTLEINKSQEFSEHQASESSNAVNSSSSRVSLVQVILDTARVITPISDFKTHKRECSTFIRRVNMLVPLFEEFRDLELSLSEEVLACFNSLETALNTARDLLLLCSTGSKLWLILEERNVAEQFLLLNTALVQALDKLPDSLGISDEVREQVDLVHSQLKRSKALEDAVDAQLNAELVSVLDETIERSPDQLKRLADSFKLDTASALRMESDALDGMAKEKPPGSLSMQGFGQLFGLLSDWKNLFPFEDLEQQEYSKPPGEDGSSNVVESRLQESSAPPPASSNSSKSVECRPQEISAQAPQASRGVESKSLETSPQPPQVSRGVDSRSQEISAQAPQASRGLESRAEEFLAQPPQVSRGVESKSEEFSARPSQVSGAVGSRPQDFSAQAPQASRGVESTSQEIYAQAPQVSRGVEGKFQEFSPLSPQVSRGVESRAQEFSAQPAQVSRGVESTSQEIYAQAPQASRGVESGSQEISAQPPQVSGAVESRPREFFAQAPLASRGVESTSQEIYAQAPQASRGVESRSQETSAQPPQVSRGVEGKFQEFSPQSPQVSRGVESRPQEFSTEPPQASRGVEGKFQEFSPQPPQESRGVESKPQEFSAQPAQLSRGIESRPQEFPAQPPQASRGVEGKFQEFSPQPPQASRGVESKPQEFSAQPVQLSRGVDSRPQETYAQPPQVSRGVEGEFQEFSPQPPQASRGVDSRPQEFPAQAPQASRAVESRPQDFSPQPPQVNRGIESRSQEFSPQSPYSSSNSIDGRSLVYPEPPPVNRDEKIKSQELSAPPPPLSSNSSSSLEGRSQEFSPQPQVSRGVESRSQEFSPQPPQASRGAESLSQEFSPRPPRSPFSSSNSIDDRSLEYTDPPQVNRDQKKSQEFSASQGYGSSKTSGSMSEPAPTHSSSSTPQNRSQEFPEYSSRPEFPELSPEYKAWNGLEGRPPEPSEPLATHRMSSSSGSSRRHAPSELSPVHKSSNVSDSRRHDHPTSSSTSETSSEEFSGSGPFRARGGIPNPASDSPELLRAATRPENHARSESCPQVQTSDSIIEDVVKKYTWEQVLDMTNDLTKTIGKGGFGAVYLGKLENEKEVAVKILDASSQQGITEFLNEVNLLKRVNHVNLVRLLGYCLEEKQVLIYEYAEEGSIWDHLQVGGKSLDWKRRLSVALQSACGLEYLHTGCHPRIIHRDIKSQNILLTKSMVAKVADFGLSKLGADQDNISKTHVTTMVKGTLGYLDPEYLKTGQLTEKSDVYSFGVVLLEIITGRKPIQNTDRKGFIGDWVEEHYNSSSSSSRGLKAVADPTLGGHFNSKALKLVLNVAKECLHPYGIERPEMTEVVQVLRKAQMIENDEKKSSKWLPFL